MRRSWIAVALALVALTLVPALAGAQSNGGVKGTVLDTTCSSGCEVECPPPPTEMPEYPPYEGDGATVQVRKAGSAKVLGRVPVEGGHFTLRLAPGATCYGLTSRCPAGPGTGRWSKSKPAASSRWC